MNLVIESAAMRSAGDVLPSPRPQYRAALLAEAFPPQVGGSGRWFWETYRRLDPAEVQILAGACPGDREFDRGHELPIRRLNLAFPETGTFSWSGLSKYVRLARQVQAIRRDSPFAVLHCARCITEGWVGWLLWRFAGLPYLCYVHGEDVNLTAHTAGGVMSSRQHRWMARRVLRDAVLLIANSENSRDMLETQWGIASVRIRVVNPGVDTRRFVPAPRDESVRAKFGWSDRQVILTVGRLQQRKGHDMLIRALPAIRAQHPDVLYAIVGNGEELPELRGMVAQMGLTNRVQFRTDVTDEELIQHYQQCDLFALPNRAVGSDVEGFGMVLLEAQACGRPVLAGASGGTRETMLVPTTGRIVPCEGGPELAETLVELLDAPQRLAEMGSAGRQWVAARFSWETVVQQMQAAFDAARAD